MSDNRFREERDHGNDDAWNSSTGVVWGSNVVAGFGSVVGRSDGEDGLGAGLAESGGADDRAGYGADFLGG